MKKQARKRVNKSKIIKLCPYCKPQDVIWSIRGFALIIVATILSADVMKAWGASWPKLVILLMSVYILLWSFQPRQRPYSRTMLLIGVLMFVILFLIFLLLFLKKYGVI